MRRGSFNRKWQISQNGLGREGTQFRQRRQRLAAGRLGQGGAVGCALNRQQFGRDRNALQVAGPGVKLAGHRLEFLGRRPLASQVIQRQFQLLATRRHHPSQGRRRIEIVTAKCLQNVFQRMCQCGNAPHACDGCRAFQGVGGAVRQFKLGGRDQPARQGRNDAGQALNLGWPFRKEAVQHFHFSVRRAVERQGNGAGQLKSRKQGSLLVCHQRRVQQLRLQFGEMGLIQRRYKFGLQHVGQQRANRGLLAFRYLALAPGIHVGHEKIRPKFQERGGWHPHLQRQTGGHGQALADGGRRG